MSTGTSETIELARPRERTLTPGPRLQLTLLSMLMLFVELGLIRWSGSYIVYLSFFTNFVLLASFLGVGVGFLRTEARGSLFGLAPVFLAILVVFLMVFPVEGGWLGRNLRFVGGFGLPALPQWISLPVVFLLSFATMAAIAEGVARAFVRFPPLEAYRLDILGSILGIVAFSALSFLQAPPVVWGIGVAVLLFIAADRPQRNGLIALGVAVVLLGFLSFVPRTHWSPYYRVTLSKPAADGSIGIDVNGRPHQRIMPLSTMKTQQSFRFLPYAHAPNDPLNNVLIIGAGSGNDVDIALSMGAKHVDAVEIDPLLYRLGRSLHPDHPYQDPRVTVHITDGRAFLHDTDQRYDLVLFAIPDSLTVLSGQASLRLESYLFTEEAMQEVRDHLTPDGVLAMYHYYSVIQTDRYADGMMRVFGHPPCLDVGSASDPKPRTVLTISMQADGLTCDHLWSPGTRTVDPETDDHPFPYLTGRTIPVYYQVALLLILLGSVLVVRASAGPLGGMRGYLDLFFMGAAFLLLETKSVVQFALLFGTTWFVNALVFAGILLTVLLAIEVARRVEIRRPMLLYGPLFVAIAVAWAVSPESLLGFGPLPRFALAVALAFAPVFLANLVFAERFKAVGSSTIAFGTNLLGAMLGGVLEYGALVVGYRALLVGVSVLYLLALVSGVRLTKRSAVAA